MEQRAKKPPTAGSFAPGRSGNPAGRPRGYAGVARQIMAETRDGADLVAWALKVWRDEKADVKERQWAHQWLSDRGLGKPLATVELEHTMHRADAPAYDLTALDAEEQKVLLATLRKAHHRALPSGEGSEGEP